ncbi:hypothetical protein [Roseinatronobacter alkalisoli]|uniref:Lipoprotein n=1 Tax=Roseinatronobacter alkalisoli TaxID=3028235 RepID=A0ABT5T6P5_9RHOB|nr:hypothetical protein [Roseinatronobacter sp. HJB301]MDD7970777.1 hypothetical protein [Roseinatronobacter sp. HJB301]
MKPFIILRILAAMALAGCAGGMAAAPNFLNGNYYMAGDETCVQIQQIAPDRVMCHDKTGQATGYRQAMSMQQMQMYIHHQQVQQAQMQQFTMELQQTAQAWQNAGQMGQPLPRYSAPSVAPVQMPYGRQVRCIGTGIYTNCRY